MNHLKKMGVSCFNLLSRTWLAILSLGANKELARRNAERGRSTLRWLTPDEQAVAEALARIIVPSDEETPGIDEVQVLGPPAIEVLDRLVAASSYRQHLYSRGLLAFDLWALKQRKCKFAEMAKEDQIGLFKVAEQVFKDRTTDGSPVIKAWQRLRAITQGSYLAGQLYPQIRNDSLQVFYTSRVSWIWLGYDGPPMDKGYPNLLARD